MEEKLLNSLARLETEKQNLKHVNLDLYSTKDLLKAINEEDKTVAYRIEEKMDEIEALTEVYIKTLDEGGRVFYIGAGTSGRMGFIDAAEIMPTYGIEEGVVEGIMCGGLPAMKRAKEAAEDHAEEGTRDLKERNFNAKDLLIGVAASGRTPYVINAMRYAKEIGAKTGSLACVSNAEISALADYPVEIIVGQEIVLGSTRMKSGTAQKLVLNMISTAVMVRRGRTYKNSILATKPMTEKTYIRFLRSIANEANVTMEEAKECFDLTDKDAILTLCMLKSGLNKEEAEALLKKHHGRLRVALKSIGVDE